MQPRTARILAAAVLLAGLFLFGLLLGVVLPPLLRGKPNPRFYNTATVIQQVQTLSELVTVKYVMEKVVVLEDVKWVAVLGESRVLMVAHGSVKAGIDLSQVAPGDVQISGKTITLKLPPPKITDAYLDEQQTRVIERTTGLLRTFDKDLEQTARMTALDDIRRAARTGGILKEAEGRAQTQLTTFFKLLGFEEVQFKR